MTQHSPRPRPIHKAELSALVGSKLPRRSIAFGVIAALLLGMTSVVVASPAAALAGTWSTTADLSAPDRYARDPQVTVDSTGLAIAIWTRSAASKKIIIQSSTLQSGGAWSTPVDLSLPGQDAFNPQVTVDSTGLATAIWAGNGIIQSSTSQTGRTWSTPVNLSATGKNAGNPQVTVDSTGLATAIWVRYNGSNNVIQSSTSQSGGAWSTPVDLSLPGRSAFFPRVTVDSTGLATAIWHRSDGLYPIIQSSTSQSGGAWSTPVDLTLTGRSANFPKVTVDSTGLATAIWDRNGIIQSRTSQSGGAWSTPVDLSLTGQVAWDPQVTVDSTGLATAIWTGYHGINYIIQSSTSQSGGAWSTPVDLSLTGQNAEYPQVTVDFTGLATAIWQRRNGGKVIIQSSTSKSGGAWSTPADLSAIGQDAEQPSVTVDSTGLVTAIWTGFNLSTTNTVIQSSTSDPRVVVVFDANSGAGSMSAQSGSSALALSLNAFSRSGFTFAGWNTTANGSGTSYANGASYDFSANLTLYAQWTAVVASAPTSGGGGSGSVAGSSDSTSGGGGSGSVGKAIIAGFAINKATLTKSMKKEIRQHLKADPGYSTAVCRGFTSGPANAIYKKLARQRGQAVCDYIAKRNPDLGVRVLKGSNTIKPGSEIRRVRITFK